jgi:hypothetical protein
MPRVRARDATGIDVFAIEQDWQVIQLAERHSTGRVICLRGTRWQQLAITCCATGTNVLYRFLRRQSYTSRKCLHCVGVRTPMQSWYVRGNF